MEVNKETEIKQDERVGHIKLLEEKRDELVKRLDIGAARIEEERKKGKDVTSWEDYWIQLLRVYEAVCEKLRDLHSQEEG